MIIDKLKLFLNWWGENLYRGLPSSLRGMFRSSIPSLGLRLLGNQRVAVSWVHDGKRRECGEYDLDGAFDFQRIAKKHARSRKYLLELGLEDGQTLHLQHSFPEAVQENLKQVVGYQLDRLTPFTLDSVYFDAKVARHDKAHKSVLADIYVAPRVAVERLLEQLRAAGVPEVDVLSAAGSNARLTRGLETAQPTTASWSRIPLYFFLLALAVALTAPIIYKQRRLEQIDGALASVQQSAAAQLEVRDKLLAAEEALGFLGEQRKSSPVMLDVVERLSEEIPPHTWLERLEIDGQQVQLRGESDQALSLIDTLEESPHFTKVSFKSPVTRSSTSGKDKFHIQATVESRHE